MSPSTIGDAASSFALNRNNINIRTRLNTLTQEMSTGKKADITRALKDTTLLRDVDRQLGLARAQHSNADEVGQRLAAMQTYLTTIDAERRGVLDAVVLVTSESTSDQISSAAENARDAFEGVVNTLNTRFGGQSLFAGNATNEVPLATANTMLGQLRLQVAGATDAATAISAIEAWFDTAGGGFETLGYLSSETGAITRKIDPTTSIEIEPKADSPAIRDLLKATAIAALASEGSMAMTDTRENATMLKEASTRLLSTAQPLNELRGRLGFAEGRIEEASTRLTARITTLGIMRNGFDTADPFETAGALQEVQIQLETHYAVTARLARLTLAEYLR